MIFCSNFVISNIFPLTKTEIEYIRTKFQELNKTRSLMHITFIYPIVIDDLGEKQNEF